MYVNYPSPAWAKTRNVPYTSLLEIGFPAIKLFKHFLTGKEICYWVSEHYILYPQLSMLLCFWTLCNISSMLHSVRDSSFSIYYHFWVCFSFEFHPSFLSWEFMPVRSVVASAYLLENTAYFGEQSSASLEVILLKISFPTQFEQRKTNYCCLDMPFGSCPIWNCQTATNFDFWVFGRSVVPPWGAMVTIASNFSTRRGRFSSPHCIIFFSIRCGRFFLILFLVSHYHWWLNCPYLITL